MARSVTAIVGWIQPRACCSVDGLLSSGCRRALGIARSLLLDTTDVLEVSRMLASTRACEGEVDKALYGTVGYSAQVRGVIDDVVDLDTVSGIIFSFRWIRFCHYRVRY